MNYTVKKFMRLFGWKEIYGCDIHGLCFKAKTENYKCKKAEGESGHFVYGQYC